MKKIYIPILVCILSIELSSQWTMQNGAEDYNCIRFNNENTGWVVGTNGIIKKTTDGGITWVTQQSNTACNLNKIEILSISKIVVVGDQGTILITNDGGSHWDKLDQPASSDYKSIQFVSDNVGFIVGTGGVFLRTIDGGVNWQQRNKLSEDINVLSFVDGNIGWIGTKLGNLYKTTDSGNSWGLQYQASGEISTLKAVNIYVGYFTDNIHVFKFSNSGGNFEVIGGWHDFSDMHFWNENTGALVSTYDCNSYYHNRITKIVNGHDIVFIDIGATESIKSIDFIDENRGWMAGAQGVIFRTTNSGATWEPLLDRGLNYNLSSVSFYDHNNGYAAGGYFQAYKGWIYATTDGGNHWRYATSTKGAVFALSVLSKNSAVAGGSLCLWVATTNNGLSWSAGGGYGERYVYISISAFDSNNVAYSACDYEGQWPNVISVKNWNLPSNIRSIYWPALFMADTNTCFIHSSNLTYRGISNIWSLCSFYSKTIFPVSANTIYGLDQNNYLFKTTDGGSSTQILNSSIQFNKLYFVDSLPGWATSGSKIYFTKDGGNTFAIGQMPFIPSALCFINANEGWIVGANGKIAYTNTGGITGIKEGKTELPSEYKVCQNYPNPFNPSTTIDYSIPKQGLVTIKVYDILGKEVADLEHNNKPAGSYSVIFNSGGLPSGVYFYRITSASFTVVKKMILLK